MKIKYLYQLIKENWPGIKKEFAETKELYILALELFLVNILLVVLTAVFPQWKLLFQWISLGVIIFVLVKLMIFTYKEYTRSSRELDNLLKEYEKDTSRFDFSFPNEFVKGIYKSEGLRGNNIDFIKKIYCGVTRLDITQKRIALIYIRSYRNTSQNIFSLSYFIGVLAIIVSLFSIIGFDRLKNNVFVLVFLFFWGISVAISIYKVSQKKTYICSVLEDTLKYLLEQEK